MSHKLQSPKAETKPLDHAAETSKTVHIQRIRKFNTIEMCIFTRMYADKLSLNLTLGILYNNGVHMRVTTYGAQV
jgi:hypothetical protein